MSNIKKRWISILTFLLLNCWCFTSYAGDINGNEQSIVSVIHGRFEANGIVYKVKQEYIDTAISYLQQDDINLSAADANAVIAEIYSNVQTGVESGYLQEVEPVVPETTANGKREPEKSQPEESTDSEEMEPVEPTETESVEMKPVEAIPIAISTLEGWSTQVQVDQDLAAESTRQLMEQVYIPWDKLIQVGIGILLLTVVMFGIILWEKKLVRKRHRKLRGLLRVVLMAELGTIYFCLAVIAGVWLGGFQEESVLRGMNQTDYYQTIYEELRQETKVSLALLGIPEQVMDQSITYERVVLAARQQVENDLRQGNYRANTTMLTEPLKADISGYLEQQSISLTDAAKTGLDLLVDRIDSKYEKLLMWPFSRWWVKLAAKLNAFAGQTLPLLGILLIAVHGMLLWIHHYRHRALRQWSVGTGIGSVAALAIGIVPLASKSAAQITMKPQYMEQFFHAYLTWISKAVITAGGVGILLAVGYWLGAKAMKERKR